MTGYPKLLVTTVPIGPRSATSSRHFAMLFSTTWCGDAPADLTEQDELLLPWCWPRRNLNWTDKGVAAYDASSLTKLNVTLENANTDLRVPVLGAQAAGLIDQWFKRPLAENFYLDDSHTDVSGTKEQKHALHSQLGSLLRLPGSIAQTLSLAKYFQIEGTLPRTVLAVPSLAGLTYEETQPQDGKVSWLCKRGETIVLAVEAQVLDVATAGGSAPPTLWLETQLEASPAPTQKDGTSAARNRDHLRIRYLTPQEAGGEWHDHAGVGILLRRASKDSGEAPWCCLTAGRLVNGKAITTPGTELLSATLQPLPLDPHVPDGSAAAGAAMVHADYVNYDEHPLCSTPSYDTSGSLDLDVKVTETEPRYHFLQVADEQNDRFRLPPLVYGDSYEAAAFIVDMAGGLPQELQGARPWRLKDDVPLVPPTASVSEKLTFLRRMGVGHADVLAWETQKNEPGAWPLVPANVFPLSSALGLSGVEGLGTPKTDAPIVGQGGARAVVVLTDQALLLTGKAFVFAVRPPATTLDVVKYWCTKLADRGGVYRNYFAQLRSAPADRGALDDPAVDSLFVRLEIWNGQQWDIVTPPAGEAGILLAARSHSGRTDWIPISVKLGTKPSVDMASGTIELPKKTQGSIDGSPLELSTIARISVQVVVSDEARKSFAPDVLARLEKHPTKTGMQLLPPEQFIIEVAARALPDSNDLLAALTRPAISDRTVAIYLDPKQAIDAGRHAPFHQLHRVVLERMLWRYRGIPRPPLPAVSDFPPGSPGEQLQFEREAFWGADELDVTRVDSVFPRASALMQPKPCLVGSDSFKEDALSRYARYRVRATSRYAGLYREHADSIVAPDHPSRTEAPRPAWLNAFVGYEGPTPNAPVIRAIVPLTSAVAGGTPMSPGGESPGGLLVLVDETPFTAGIAEALEAQVVTEARSQSGPDPILARANPPSGPPVDLSWSPKLDLDGPYGHTRDLDPRLPAYFAGSFLLRPPEKARPWDFAKVRFRRVVQPAKSSEAPIVSAWTTPQWVQLLPPHTFGADRIKAVITNGKLEITLERQYLPGPPQTFDPYDADDRFRYAVLVTSDIRDHVGAPAETFLEFCLCDSGGDDAALSRDIRRGRGNVTLNAVLATTSRGSLIVRLCEIQLATGVQLDPGAAPRGPLDVMFPRNDEDDVPARITRIAPPCRLESAEVGS